MKNAWPEKAVFWLKNREKALFWLAVLTLTGVLFWLCAAKYDRYGYNGIDLAYFNQVFWNTVRGRFFEQSIHPHLSLGDHAELLIPLLAPLYALWQDPRMLLLLQAAALGACAWPIRQLARNRFGTARLVPLAFAIAWLLNPLVHNIALFEFHLLPFAIFPLLKSLVAYRHDDRRGFAAWAIIAMLAREDVALVVMTLPLLAWLEKRSLWWRVAPLALGGVWFMAAMALIRSFAPSGGYKFSIYYAWVGPALARPWELVAHTLIFANFEMLLGFLMAAAFLPLFAWRPLVLLLAPLAQIMLGAPGGGSLVLETHYASLFLPGLALAAIDGYAAAPAALARIRRLGTMLSAAELRLALPVFCSMVALYAMLTIGPLPTSMARALQPHEPAIADMNAVVAFVPADAAVAASYALLPRLSSREHVYAAHYLFLGVTQFAEQPYDVPENLRYLAFDDRDLEIYAAQFRHTGWAAPYYDSGLARLRATAGQPILRRGAVALYDRRDAGDSKIEGLPTKMPEVSPAARLLLDGDRSIRLSE